MWKTNRKKNRGKYSARPDAQPGPVLKRSSGDLDYFSRSRLAKFRTWETVPASKTKRTKKKNPGSPSLFIPLTHTHWRSIKTTTSDHPHHPWRAVGCSSPPPSCASPPPPKHSRRQAQNHTEFIHLLYNFWWISCVISIQWNKLGVILSDAFFSFFFFLLLLLLLWPQCLGAALHRVSGITPVRPRCVGGGARPCDAVSPRPSRISSWQVINSLT